MDIKDKNKFGDRLFIVIIFALTILISSNIGYQLGENKDKLKLQINLSNNLIDRQSEVIEAQSELIETYILDNETREDICIIKMYEEWSNNYNLTIQIYSSCERVGIFTGE